MTHLSNWIEIPARDLARAILFYETILETKLATTDIGSMHYAVFPTDDRYNAGALAQGDGYEPSTQGTTVYLDGSSGMDQILIRVSEAGGQILLSKTFLSPEAGFIGFFVDSEGNKIGLQSMI